MTGATPFLQARKDREKLELERVVHNLCPKCEAPKRGEARVYLQKSKDKRHAFYCTNCNWVDYSEAEDSMTTIYGYPGGKKEVGMKGESFTYTTVSDMVREEEAHIQDLCRRNNITREEYDRQSKALADGVAEYLKTLYITPPVSR